MDLESLFGSVCGGVYRQYFGVFEVRGEAFRESEGCFSHFEGKEVVCYVVRV